MSGTEVEELKDKVSKLEELVSKLSKVTAKTGQAVLELQINKQKRNIEEFDKSFQTGKTSNYHSKYDSTDLATNEDLVQLVEELQGQLEAMDERSIRRTANGGKQKSTDNLAPVPNAYGEVPDVTTGDYPLTLGDFEKIDNLKLAKMARFYELMSPHSGALKAHSEGSQLEQKIGEISLGSDAPQPTDEELEKELKEMTTEQLNDLYNDVARYLGVHCRKGTSLW